MDGLILEMGIVI